MNKKENKWGKTPLLNGAKQNEAKNVRIDTCVPARKKRLHYKKQRNGGRTVSVFVENLSYIAIEHDV